MAKKKEKFPKTIVIRKEYDGKDVFFIADESSHGLAMGQDEGQLIAAVYEFKKTIRLTKQVSIEDVK